MHRGCHAPIEPDRVVAPIQGTIVEIALRQRHRCDAARRPGRYDALVITQYRCTACQVTSTVELLDTDLARETEAKAKILAEVRLAHATCPACGAKNPEGLAEQLRDERNIMIFTIVMMVGLSIGAYFAPSIVLVWLGLFSALTIYFLIKRPRWVIAFNLATTIGMGVVAWFLPRWAFLVLAIPTVQILLKRRDPAEREEPWKQRAEQLRFFDTSQRRP